MKRFFSQVQSIPSDIQSIIDPTEDASERLCLRLKLPKLSESQPTGAIEEEQKSFVPVRLVLATRPSKQDILNTLQQLGRRMPLASADTLLALDKLTSILEFESREALSASAFQLWGQLCRHPAVDPRVPINTLLSSLKFKACLASNPGLYAPLLKALTAIAASKQIEASFILHLIGSVLGSSATPAIRTICVHAMAQLEHSSGTTSHHRRSVLLFMDDSDGRVRAMALRSLRESTLKSNVASTLNDASASNLPLNGMDVDDVSQDEQALYAVAVSALTDESEEVQLEALRTIWTLANRRPKQIVDDAFRKMCNMVSDTSMRVRAEACGLLGILRGVSEGLMLQSLSKNMLKVGADAFGGKVKEDPFDPSASAANTDIVRLTTKSKLIDSSANGAFVHGLEDEFKEVRDAALSSICELSHRSKSFALSSTEFFVDMFNDEIDTVRVNAIQSLSKIGKIIFLTEDQLIIVLAMLDDATQCVRLATRKLLQTIRLINAKSLHNTINNLISSMAKHYIEKDSILPTFSALGRNHPNFVELLYEDLLKLDTRFIMREPRVDDIYYASIAILLLNAAKENPNLIELLPKFVHRHYLYLKRHYPLLVPDVPSLEATISHSLIQQKSQLSDSVLAGLLTSNSTASHRTTSTPSIGFATDFSFFNHEAIRNFCLGDAAMRNKRKDAISLEKLAARTAQIIRDALHLHSTDPHASMDSIISSMANLKQEAETLADTPFLVTLEFYVVYLDMLEKSLLLLYGNSTTIISEKQLLRQVATLRTIYLGLTVSARNQLTQLLSFRTTEHAASVSIDLLRQKFWECMTTPFSITHMLKKTSGVLALGNSLEPGTPREFYTHLPLFIRIDAELKMLEDLSDVFVLIEGTEPMFSELSDITLNFKRWEHNKLAAVAVSLVKVKQGLRVELAPPVPLLLHPKTR